MCAPQELSPLRGLSFKTRNPRARTEGDASVWADCVRLTQMVHHHSPHVKPQRQLSPGGTIVTTATYPPADGAISRRLSPRSFETSNPEQCAIWLRAIGYTDVPTRGTEYARLQLDAGTCII